MKLFRDSGVRKLDLRFLFRKPRVTLRAIKYGLLKTYFRSDALPKIDIIYNYACNFKCKHCFATALERKKRKSMSYPELRRLADQAYDLGVLNINFQGGEPLVWKNLDKIIRVCGRNRFWFSITTNGYLLNLEKAHQLKKMGLDNVIVSIDSGNSKQHDEFRQKKESFKRAVDSIDYCIEAGLKVGVSSCVTRESTRSQEFQDLMEYVASKNLMHTAIIATPSGNWRGNLDVMLTRADKEFIEKAHNDRVLFRRDIHRHIGKKGCRAVTETLYITPYGDVLPCPFIHVSLGNAFDEDLKKIRERGIQIPEFKNSPYMCLAGEPSEFMDKYISRTFSAKKLPMEFDDFFNSK